MPQPTSHDIFGFAFEITAFLPRFWFWRRPSWRAFLYVLQLCNRYGHTPVLFRRDGDLPAVIHIRLTCWWLKRAYQIDATPCSVPAAMEAVFEKQDSCWIVNRPDELPQVADYLGRAGEITQTVG